MKWEERSTLHLLLPPPPPTCLLTLLWGEEEEEWEVESIGVGIAASRHQRM